MNADEGTLINTTCRERSERARTLSIPALERSFMS